MKNGFFKITATAAGTNIADPIGNADEILYAVSQADKSGADAVVFSEMSLTGYGVQDLAFQEPLKGGVIAALEKLRVGSEKYKPLFFVGCPITYFGRTYSAAVAFCRGRILGVVPKTSVSDRDGNCESRYFGSEPVSGEITLGKSVVPISDKLLFVSSVDERVKIGCEFHEDLYMPLPTSVRHAAAGATVIVNLAADGEGVGKCDKRRFGVKAQSARLIAGYAYSDAGVEESTGDTVFGGHAVIAERGKILCENAPFDDRIATTDIDIDAIAADRERKTNFKVAPDPEYKYIEFEGANGGNVTRTFEKNPFVPSDFNDERAEYILTLAATGLKKRLEVAGSAKPVIGISGGLDSTLALLIALRAADSPEDIIAVTMPGFGTGKRTLGQAEKLMKATGVTRRKVDITQVVTRHLRDIGHGGEKDITYENAQARERTQILMDIANGVGGIVVGTGDLSEAALGWCTYGGDQLSMYNPNASIPKTLVKALVGYEARRVPSLAAVLKAVLETDVSPELLPPEGGKAQKTEDTVGPYELIDFFIYYILRYGFGPKKIIFMASRAFEGKYTGDEIKKWLGSFYRRFFTSQFKRACAPDGAKTGSVSLSSHGDFRMPSGAIYKLWLDELNK